MERIESRDALLVVDVPAGNLKKAVQEMKDRGVRILVADELQA